MADNTRYGGGCPGGSLSRGSLSRGVSVRGGLCPGGLCPGVSDVMSERTENHHFTITTHTSQQVKFFYSLIFSHDSLTEIYLRCQINNIGGWVGGH